MYEDCDTDIDKTLVHAHQPDNPEPSQNLKYHTYTWTVNAWVWDFDGVFSKKDVGISIHLNAANENEEVKVNSLDYFPLRFDSGDLRSKPRAERQDILAMPLQEIHLIPRSDPRGPEQC